MIRFFGVLWFSCAACPVMAMPEEKSEPIVKRALIEERGPTLVANADLGALQAGKTVEITLRLVNDSDFSFPVLRVQTTCNCVRVISGGAEIPARGSLDLALSVDVPRNSKTPQEILSFTIFYGESGSEGIEVYVTYDIAGLVSFKNVLTHHTTASIGAKSHTFRIPVLVTKPVELGQIEISQADSLKDLKVALKESEAAQWLDCTLAIDPTRSKSLIGRVWMRHPTSGELSEITLVIEIDQPCTIAPSILRFTKTDAEEEVYEANGILRLVSTATDKPSESQGRDVDLEWWVEQGELHCIKKEIATNIYRLRFSWRPDPSASEPDEKIIRPREISGRVLSGSLRASLTLPVVFESHR